MTREQCPYCGSFDTYTDEELIYTCVYCGNEWEPEEEGAEEE